MKGMPQVKVGGAIKKTFSKGVVYLVLALLMLGITGGVVARSLADSASYVPENKVSAYNSKRSQSYLSGEGYRVMDSELKEHRKEEEKKMEMIEREPEPRIQGQLRMRSSFSVNNNTSYTPSTRRSYNRKTPSRTDNKDKKDDKDEKEEELPVIKSSLKNGETVSGKKKKFTVKATSYSGEKIDASDVFVNVNGKRILETGGGSYLATLKKGTNKIEITAKDKDGKERVVQYKIKCDPKGKKKKLGKLTVVVTAKALGIETVAAQKKVTIYEDEELSDVVERYFDGIEDVTAVDIGNGYYELGHIQKEGIINEIPESVAAELEEQGIPIPDKKDSLGLGDFGAGSGWLYEVDGERPDKYMSAMDPEPGSSVEILYTLSAM